MAFARCVLCLAIRLRARAHIGTVPTITAVLIVNGPFTTFSAIEKRTAVFQRFPEKPSTERASRSEIEPSRGRHMMLFRTEEKRNVERYRMLKAGSITFGGSAIDCVVRNLFRNGRRIGGGFAHQAYRETLHLSRTPIAAKGSAPSCGEARPGSG